MGAKIITLSQKDQDLLRVTFDRAIDWQSVSPLAHSAIVNQQVIAEMTDRIKDLRERLL